jgi:hypothetical protein
MNFPDVEKMVIGFLQSRVTVPIRTTVPKTRPTKFLRIYANGGAAQNRIVERALITVDAWASDSVEAHDLAQVARHAFLNEATGMPLVRRVEEQTRPYSTPDPDSGTPIYRFSVMLTVRASRH